MYYIYCTFSCRNSRSVTNICIHTFRYLKISYVTSLPLLTIKVFFGDDSRDRHKNSNRCHLQPRFIAMQYQWKRIITPAVVWKIARRISILFPFNTGLSQNRIRESSYNTPSFIEYLSWWMTRKLSPVKWHVTTT